jgi:manganese/iron transport system permease protein
METLLLPFQFPFMQQAFVISLLVAVPMALLSCFLVLKGWALMGDAISHAVLPGIVAAYVLNIPLVIGAFAAGMICAGATGWLKENSRIKEDTIMGVVFSGMFGLGIVMYVAVESDIHLDHILFGDMLGVTWRDIGVTAAISAVVTGVVALRFRDFQLLIFDEQHAQAVGLPVKLLHYGLLALISLSVVGALKAVGIILAIAMLVAPGAIAYLWTDRFGVMLALATVIAAGAAVLGIYLSFFIDSAPAPTIVLLMSVAFVVSFVVVTIRQRRTSARLG